MKKLLTVAFFLLAMAPKAQQRTAIVGCINDEYIIFDTCDTGYGKEISRGGKKDSCLLLRYMKNAYGSEWLKIKTADATGFILLDFVSFDKSKINDLRNTKSDLIFSSSEEDWLKCKKKESYLIESRDKLEKQNKLKAISNEFNIFKSKSVLFIGSCSFPESDYLKYPGFNVSIYNSHPKKVIKYMWFTIRAYNPVNDIVGTNTVKAIGPVKPNQFGEYNFEFVFKSNIIETCKLINIKIKYMDETTVTFEKPVIDKLLMKQETFWSYIEKMNGL